jgi:hypothetical protein
MFSAEQIRECISKAAVSEAELSLDVANDVAFHLTDWLGDLEAYVEFCRSPGSLSPAQVNKLLIAFLVHVPNHVAAAAKLYTDIPVQDVFGVGAVAEKEGGDV